MIRSRDIATLIWCLVYGACVPYGVSLVTFASAATAMLMMPLVIGSVIMGMFWGDVLIGRIFFPNE